MKKALLISCFNWYKTRLEPIREILLEKGYEVTILIADFDHFNKAPIRNKYPECVYITVPRYKKNLSIRRVYSHLFFGREVNKYLEKEQPDLVYCQVPPNNVAKYCTRYKKQKPETKLILDIIDLWPESIPQRSVLCKVALGVISPIWKKWRKDCIETADHIFTECDFYREKLRLPPEKSSTLYLFKEQTEEEQRLVQKIINEKKDDGIVRFAYLGSMNHIIDIEGIVVVIKKFIEDGYECQLHAIGDGENRKEFEKVVIDTGCITYFYGSVHDEMRKIRILAPCDYALNMMKSTSEVGLTTKSIDYLSYGLPLINNIKGDTWGLVDDKGCGVNVQNLDELQKSFDHTKIMKVYLDKFVKKTFIASAYDRL